MRERLDEVSFEPERYELAAGPAYHFDLAGGTSFKALGGGIVVVLMLDRCAGRRNPAVRQRGPGATAPQEIGAWLHIGEDGRHSLHRASEVGQNIRTSLTQVVAEELRVPMARSAWSWATPI